MSHIKITFNSPVILGFAFASLLVMVLGYITMGKSNELLFMTYHSSLRSPFTYLRFLTHVLGHGDRGRFSVSLISLKKVKIGLSQGPFGISSGCTFYSFSCRQNRPAG